MTPYEFHLSHCIIYIDLFSYRTERALKESAAFIAPPARPIQKGKSAVSSTIAITTLEHQRVSEVIDEGGNSGDEEEGEGENGGEDNKIEMEEEEEEEEGKGKREEEMEAIAKEPVSIPANTIEVADPGGMSI